MSRGCRRLWLTVALLALATAANAQTWGVARAAALAIRQATPSPAPLQPSGFPPPADKVGQLPGPQTGEQYDHVTILNPVLADEHGDIVHFTGGVEMVYRGYRIFARDVVGNRVTQVFVFSGDVSVIGKDAVIKGERVTINFNTNHFKAEQGFAQLKPGLSQGLLQGDVFVKARLSEGDNNEIHSYYSDTTTCDLDSPHYEIRAYDSDLRPNLRIIFRKADIRLFDRSIIRLPYLSIPLDKRFYDNLPVVGTSPDEGFFVKTRYGIPLRGDSQLYARFDVMTRFGVGIGGDYVYKTRASNGVFRLYTIAGTTHMLDVSESHSQNFRWGQLSIDSSVQHNDYLVAPNSTLISNRISVNLPQAFGNSDRITFNQTSNSSEGFSSRFESFAVNDQRSFGNNLRTTLGVNYSDNSSSSTFGGAIDSQRVDILFDAQDDLKKATAELQYQRSVPIGQTGGFFSSADQTPVLSLATDSYKLFGSKGNGFPVRANLSLGDFSDPGMGGAGISREEFDLGFQRPDSSQRRLRWDLAGGYKQSFYSDDTALYILNLASTLTYDLGKDTSINLRYNYIMPFGYTPLSIDMTGRTDFVSTDFSFRPTKTLLIGGETGYDLLKALPQTTSWQELGLRVEYQPKDYIRVRSLATYDTTLRSWSNLRFDLAYKAGATFVGIGARYDAERHVWGNFNAFVDGLKWGRMKISVLLEYDGYLRMFDSRQYSVIYDLHCAEAVFQVIDNPIGFRTGRTIVFFIRLKAFPFDTPFGSGQRGQPIGTGTGIDF